MGFIKSKFFPLLSRVRNFFSNSWFFAAKLIPSAGRKDRALNSEELDRKLVYSLSKSKIPSWSQLRHLGRTFSSKELALIRFFSLLIVLSVGFLGLNFVRTHLVIAPISGGRYVEGVVGGPRYINPLYASASAVDGDLASLIYSSLLKYDKEGRLTNDLAEGYEMSADGKVYTLKIRDDAEWHKGGKVTAADVVFTFEAIKNPAYNSPLRFNFNGVEIAQKDERTVEFTLAEAYAPFLNLLTFGILPAAEWEQVAPETAGLAELNLKPIGSGPYKFKSLTKDKLGNVKSYNLSANKDYYGRKPYIKDLVFRFYSNGVEAANALNQNDVDGLDRLTKDNKDNLIAKSSLNFRHLNLPQIKAVFFNGDKNPVLKDVKVRQALAYATPKESLIKDVLEGEARMIAGPILPENFAYNDQVRKYDFDLEKAKALLADDGWKKETVLAATSTASSTAGGLAPGEWLVKETAVKAAAKTTSSSKSKVQTKKDYLAVSLTALDDEESARIAELIKSSWEKIGAHVELVLVPARDVQAEIIKPRQYEALIFSQFVGADPDEYVFWHSSQAGQGGLNLSNYKNEEADKMLEEGRLAAKPEERLEKYRKFQEILANDSPAIFLYSSYYTYIQSKKIRGFDVKSIVSPAGRFADVTDWYVKTGKRLRW